MTQVTMIREWDPEEFHARIVDLEKKGWQTRRDSYKITAEMNPETGLISHVHSIELFKESQPE